MRSEALGRYIVADSSICHGKPTFRGTRILVADVLEQVASGMAWEAIIEEWRGALTKEAIAEAVHLAREALVIHGPPLRGSWAKYFPKDFDLDAELRKVRKEWEREMEEIDG